MRVSDTQSHMPLAVAAHRLGRSWPEMYRLVLTRQVRAEQRRGRWFVATEDIERLMRQSDSAQAPT
jgi:hypothetical protein